MSILIATTFIGLILSILSDREKTYEGIKKALLMFLKILPSLLSIIIIISIVLYVIPEEYYLNYLGGKGGTTGYLFAALIGSITLMPGFIAYPLCGFLIKDGVGYPVIGVFITTLMMVGILTIPIEIKYFGLKIAIIRNVLSFIGALFIGFLIAVMWGVL